MMKYPGWGTWTLGDFDNHFLADETWNTVNSSVLKFNIGSKPDHSSSVSGFWVQPAKFSSHSQDSWQHFFPGGKWTWSLCSRCRRAAKVGNAGRSSGILKIDWNCTHLSKTNSLPLLDQQACCVRPGGNNGYTSHDRYASHDWYTSHDWWCGAEWWHCNVAHSGGLAPVVVWWKDCSWDLPLIYKS